MAVSPTNIKHRTSAREAAGGGIRREGMVTHRQRDVPPALPHVRLAEAEAAWYFDFDLRNANFVGGRRVEPSGSGPCLRVVVI